MTPINRINLKCNNIPIRHYTVKRKYFGELMSIKKPTSIMRNGKRLKLLVAEHPVLPEYCIDLACTYAKKRPKYFSNIEDLEKYFDKK